MAMDAGRECSAPAVGPNSAPACNLGPKTPQQPPKASPKGNRSCAGHDDCTAPAWPLAAPREPKAVPTVQPERRPASMPISNVARRRRRRRDLPNAAAWARGKGERWTWERGRVAACVALLGTLAALFHAGPVRGNKAAKRQPRAPAQAACIIRARRKMRDAFGPSWGSNGSANSYYNLPRAGMCNPCKGHPSAGLYLRLASQPCAEPAHPHQSRGLLGLCPS